jgi:hypothetical protein
MNDHFRCQLGKGLEGLIYTSGYNENVIVHDGVLDAGVTLVPKPYSKEDLLAAIDKATLNIVEAATRRPA